MDIIVGSSRRVSRGERAAVIFALGLTLGVVLGALLSGGLDRAEQTPPPSPEPGRALRRTAGGAVRVLGGAMVTAILALLLRAQAAWASLPATVWVAANVARCESSARLDDGAAVLQTAINRARLWRRPLLSVMTQSRQFAWRCGLWPRTPSVGHVRLGLAAAMGTLQAPAWASEAYEYLGPSDRAGLVATRGPAVGRIVHTFHGRRRP